MFLVDNTGSLGRICCMSRTAGYVVFYSSARAVTSVCASALSVGGKVWQGLRSFNITSGAIIGDGDHKSCYPGAPMIWDNFSIFRTNCVILTTISSWIHARVVGSGVNVVTLRDQTVRVVRLSSGFFSAMALNKAGSKNQGVYK